MGGLRVTEAASPSLGVAAAMFGNRDGFRLASDTEIDRFEVKSRSKAKPFCTIFQKDGLWDCNYDRKHVFEFSVFGITRDIRYKRSDVRLKGPGYDYTLSGVRGEEDPGFRKLKRYAPFYLVSDAQHAQFDFRIRYWPGWLSGRLGIEFGTDHFKFKTPPQYVLASGYISESASAEHAFNGESRFHIGSPGDHLAYYEHTDGLNPWVLKLIYAQPLVVYDRYALSLVASAGLSIPVPKTNATIDGERLDAPFRVAGFGATFGGGLRLEGPWWYLQAQVNGHALHMPWIKAVDGRAEQDLLVFAPSYEAGVKIQTDWLLRGLKSVFSR